MAILLTVTAGTAIGQSKDPSAGMPPASTRTSDMVGDKSKHAERAPGGPNTEDTVDVSPGVGTVERADGKPSIPGAQGR